MCVCVCVSVCVDSGASLAIIIIHVCPYLVGDGGNGSQFLLSSLHQLLSLRGEGGREGGREGGSELLQAWLLPDFLQLLFFSCQFCLH